MGVNDVMGFFIFLASSGQLPVVSQWFYFNSTISRLTLDEYETHKLYSLNFRTGKKLGVYPIYKDSSLELIEFLATYRPNNRLMIVRNPWARLASAYDDKVIDKKWKLKVMII